MKKIYSFFALLIAGLVSMVASAQDETRTVKIHIDDPTRLDKVYTGDSWNPKSVIDQIDEDNVLTLEFTQKGVNNVVFQTKSSAKVVSLAFQDGTVPEFEKDAWGDKPVRVETKQVTLTAYDYYGKWGVTDGDEFYLVT